MIVRLFIQYLIESIISQIIIERFNYRTISISINVREQFCADINIIR